jgi:protein subunit release factor B
MPSAILRLRHMYLVDDSSEIDINQPILKLRLHVQRAGGQNVNKVETKGTIVSQTKVFKFNVQKPVPAR